MHHDRKVTVFWRGYLTKLHGITFHKTVILTFAIVRTKGHIKQIVTTYISDCGSHVIDLVLLPIGS